MEGVLEEAVDFPEEDLVEVGALAEEAVLQGDGDLFTRDFIILSFPTSWYVDLISAYLVYMSLSQQYV